MDHIQDNSLYAFWLPSSNDDVKPVIASVVKFGAERSMWFDTDDHLISRILELHIVCLLLILSKPVGNLVHLISK